MEFKNYTETLVEEALKDYFNKNTELMEKITKNELIEIKAYALNQLQPHYITSQKGYAITKLEEVNIQTKATVLKTVIMAVEQITNNKR